MSLRLVVLKSLIRFGIYKVKGMSFRLVVHKGQIMYK